jgi:metalloendopeptidase OMA1, mitochondrial
VLGHEIAHNVAHHSAERMSQALPLMGIAFLISYFLQIDMGFSKQILDLTFSLPGSRKQESEADYIGLMMMAQSCYDPQQAVGLWERMEKAEKSGGGGAPPQWLSTHPSNHNRIGQIQGWLSEAELKRQDGNCESTLNYGEAPCLPCDRHFWFR